MGVFEENKDKYINKTMGNIRYSNMIYFNDLLFQFHQVTSIHTAAIAVILSIVSIVDMSNLP